MAHFKLLVPNICLEERSIIAKTTQPGKLVFRLGLELEPCRNTNRKCYWLNHALPCVRFVRVPAGNSIREMVTEVCLCILRNV